MKYYNIVALYYQVKAVLTISERLICPDRRFLLFCLSLRKSFFIILYFRISYSNSAFC